MRLALTALALAAITVAFVIPASSASAATIWSGPDVAVAQPDGAPGTVTDILITGVASLGRAAGGPLCNAAGGDTCGDGGSNPSDFEFAFSGFSNPAITYGSAANYALYTFDSLKNSLGGNLSNNLPPTAAPAVGVGHIISSDVYFDIEITHWQSGNMGGGFSYTRSSVPEPGTLSLLGLGLIGLRRAGRSRSN